MLSRKRALVGSIVTFAIATSALGVIGCGNDDAEKPATFVRVTATYDFGESQLHQVDLEKVPTGETVMRALERSFKVGFDNSGKMVTSINGVPGGSIDGDKVDWFYFVNGSAATTGAAEHKIVAGDQIWWDRRKWEHAMNVPAVVGSFPEPFKSGMDGKKRPVRIDCARGSERVCSKVSARLAEHGVKSAQTSLGQAPGPEVVRLVVGPWADIRADVAARTLEKGPTVSGVFARPDSRGQNISLLDDHGKVAGKLGTKDGLIAATALRDQKPTWVITGTDSQGCMAAADALVTDVLEHRFAVAVRSDRARGDIGLPVVHAKKAA